MSQDKDFKTENITISLMLNVQLKTFPKNFKEIAKKMEVINGLYDGILANEELVMFLYACGGATLKFERQWGGYYIFKSNFTIHVELNYRNLTPHFPFNWKFYGSDAGIYPTIIVDFAVESSLTSMMTSPLDVALSAVSNGVIDAGSFDYKIFNGLNFGLEGHEDDLVLTPKN